MKKSIVIGIILLLTVGLSITSSTGVNIEQASEQMTRTGELAWWEFDETSGNTASDSSGHGYDGNVVGATWTGGGLDFDGMDDYVDLDAHSEALGMNKTDDYLIFVRFQSTGSGMFYSMSHTNPARAYLDLMLDVDGKISVAMGDETCLFDVSSSGTFDDGEPHYVQMYFYGDASEPTLELYVDSSLEASTTEWLCPMLDEDFLTNKVGRKSLAASDFFGGVIDDVKIYKNYIPGTPPTAPIITGPKIRGRAGTPYEYTFTSTDADGDDVSYYIQWGDGDITSWTTFLPSGTPYKETHTYTSGGSFTVAAKAKDETGLTSDWSTQSVTMPRNKATNNMLLLRLLERFPLLQKLLLLIK